MLQSRGSLNETTVDEFDQKTIEGMYAHLTDLRLPKASQPLYSFASQLRSIVFWASSTPEVFPTDQRPSALLLAGQHSGTDRQ